MDTFVGIMHAVIKEIKEKHEKLELLAYLLALLHCISTDFVLQALDGYFNDLLPNSLLTGWRKPQNMGHVLGRLPSTRQAGEKIQRSGFDLAQSHSQSQNQVKARRGKQSSSLLRMARTQLHQPSQLPHMSCPGRTCQQLKMGINPGNNVS